MSCQRTEDVRSNEKRAFRHSQAVHISFLKDMDNILNLSLEYKFQLIFYFNGILWSIPEKIYVLLFLLRPFAIDLATLSPSWTMHFLNRSITNGKSESNLFHHSNIIQAIQERGFLSGCSLVPPEMTVGPWRNQRGQLSQRTEYERREGQGALTSDDHNFAHDEPF